MRARTRACLSVCLSVFVCFRSAPVGLVVLVLFIIVVYFLSRSSSVTLLLFFRALPLLLHPDNDDLRGQLGVKIK